MSDKLFMELAEETAAWSRDRSTKTGCVIVAKNQMLVSGWNEIPHGVSDTPERRERPEKYFWTEHAERNAVYSAAKSGVSLNGATAYINWFPCIDCARALVQVGVTRVVCKPVNLDHAKYAEDFKRASILFDEAGVEVAFLGDAA